MDVEDSGKRMSRENLEDACQEQIGGLHVGIAVSIGGLKGYTTVGVFRKQNY